MSFVNSIALIAFAIPIGAFGQSSENEQKAVPTFKSDAREVAVVFRAVGKDGKLVSGITPNEIRVDDEGVQRAITSFAGDVALAQVVVAADVSGSMGTVIEPLQGALFNFADRISEDTGRDSGDVLLSLLPFSDTATMLVDRTPDPREFKNAVSRLRPSGATALVDAILSTLLNAFGEKEISPRRVAVQESTKAGPLANESTRKRLSAAGGLKRSKFLVIFTDAGENSSTHQWSDIATALLGQGVVIYSVIFDSGTPDSNVPKLSGVTKESGGRVFRSRAEDLKQVYEQIARDIRGRYAVTFSASDVQNPRVWRNIRVSTTRPGVTIFARSGYCPESPCQKTDGTFMGGQPKSWNDVMTLNRDPAVVSAIRQRFRGLRFEYSHDTENIISGLRQNALLVERRWSTSGKESKSALVTHSVGGGSQSVSVDSEVCGISVAPESARPVNANSDSSDISSDRSVLRVLDPEIRLSRKPGSNEHAASSDDLYFQSQALFYLADPSGRIPSRLRVQCNRPHFLVGDGLVEFAIQALGQALKITPQDTISGSLKSSR